MPSLFFQPGHSEPTPGAAPCGLHVRFDRSCLGPLGQQTDGRPWADSGWGWIGLRVAWGPCLGERWGPEQKGFLSEVNSLLAFSVMWEDGSSKAWGGRGVRIADHS